MDIHNTNFWYMYPDIIKVMAMADYIAIDLEMSGIDPGHQDRHQRPTKDSIYQNSKEAARIFHVLQLGITCISSATNGEKHTFWSYNFHLSPLFSDDANGETAALTRMVDRTVSVSTKTLHFLRANRIRLEDSYNDGIPYLSRAEETEIGPHFLFQDDKQNRDIVDIETQDDETQSFYYSTRDKIRQWEENPGHDDYVNISNPHGGRINRFQQRLIHQLLDHEFPGKYRAYCKLNQFMQILKEDDPHEAKILKKKIESRKKTLCRQRGLRYIVEALVGGDFATDSVALIDHGDGTLFRRSRDEEAAKQMECQVNLGEEVLKKKTPVLVGHNMFVDLCFLYQTFFGPLPDTLAEFTSEIHKLFPRIVDTKYMVTHGGHDMLSADNLEELFTEAEKQTAPMIKRMKPTWQNNNATKPGSHHAGYDSDMTATLFAKKAWELSDNNQGSADKKPDWDDSFFKTYGNKLRVGNAGTLDLAETAPMDDD